MATLTSQITVNPSTPVLVAAANPARIFLRFLRAASGQYLGNSTVSTVTGMRPGTEGFDLRYPESTAEFYAIGTAGDMLVLEITQDV
jgi:hypothetical protein